MSVQIQVGDVIKVLEADYMYGTGTLILRVTSIGGLRRGRDGDWLELEGLKLRTDCTPLEQQPRSALVRLNAVTLLKPPQPQQ